MRADPGSEQRAEGEVADGYRALRTAVAARLLARDVVRVTGPEAASYLQGQCSQDVDAIAVGQAAESLVLSPQGRIDAYLRIGRLSDEEFVLDTESGFGPPMVARLERFRLRTRVDFELVEWTCVGLRGPGAVGAAGAAGAVGAPDAGPVLRVAVDWPGLNGVDLLGPRRSGSGIPWVDEGEGVVTCPEEAWEAARIESGQPVLGREIDERTIAAEVGLVERTVSFTKGCFTGQELVARLDARGSNVARRLCGIVVEGDPASAAELVGAVVWSPPSSSGQEGGEGREVGRVTSAAWSPGHNASVALAILHRSVTPPASVVVRDARPEGEGGRAAVAGPLPLTPPG